MSMPRKIRCTVEALIDHGEHVYTIDLRPERKAPSFQPGQFLHLSVDDYDPASFWPESRVFSIASSPRERERLRICYAVKGAYTKKMEKSLRVGVDVWVKMPYGDFVIDDARDAVLIAGGTGISAFTAFLESLTPTSTQAVTLIYGVRNPTLFLFYEMICSQQAKVANLAAFYFSETVGVQPELAPAATMSGRIALASVWSHVGDSANSVFYLAGPPVMQESLGQDLQARSIPESQIRIDAWQ